MTSFFSAPSAPSFDADTISTLPLPEIEQGGHPINLIVAVRDHAPGRIDAIQKEISELERRMHELHVEEQTLSKLLAIVSPA